ncbi:MAG: hypothetical protein Q4E31_07520 [Intestinibacter bartlettii]|uniref:hypothetical protein n=1 Tax=Intestinibacter bartlettii TaxID=261299 RepID=UPI0026EFADC0|nr:hypothetical protein [Intestinibacter bartlettii]MDO5010657.1 hypothetical protein [Intestinibacter bartlettii]
MKGKVNTLFLGKNEELLAKDNVALECETDLTENEKNILKDIFDAIKDNNFENEGIKFSLDDYSKDALINLQNKKVMIINIEKKEYVLTQWYTMVCNKESNEVTIHVEDIVLEYLKLFVLDKVK